MKNLILAFIVLLSIQAFGQQSNAFFGQCLIEIQTKEEMAELETAMRENPYARVVRLDYNTQRAFVLTKDIETFSEADFTSWFGEYSEKVRCIQVGRQGIDMIKPYPFTDCDK
jgi:hypothetical protein